MATDLYKVYVNDHNGDTAKRWYCWYYIPNTNTKAGQRFSKKKERIRTWVPMLPTQAARRAWVQEYKDSVADELRAMAEQKQQARVARARKHLKLSDALADAWDGYDKLDLAPNSIVSYTTFVNKFQDWLMYTHRCNVRPDDFTSDDAFEFIKYLKYKGGPNKTGLENSTINSYHNIISSLFNIMRKRKQIAENPFGEIQRRPAEPRIKKIISQEEYATYIRYLREQDRGLFIMATLIRALLCRPIELLRAQIEAFDHDKQLLYIARTIGKTRMDRAAVIPDSVMPYVQHFKTFPGHFYPFSTNDLLPGPKRIHKNRVFDRHKKLVRDIGLPAWWTLYKNKHYGNYLYAKMGMPDSFIQRQNGHTSLSTTQIYQKTIPYGSLIHEKFKEAEI